MGQYGVETSSLKPIGKNPQDDFNSITINTLQLIRTHTINVIGAISRMIIGVNNVRRLWNIKMTQYCQCIECDVYNDPQRQVNTDAARIERMPHT